MEIRHYITHLKAAWMGSHSVLTKPSNSNFGLEKIIQKEMVKNNDWYAWRLDMYNIGNNDTKKIIILLREYCLRSTKNSCHWKLKAPCIIAFQDSSNYGLVDTIISVSSQFCYKSTRQMGKGQNHTTLRQQ